jgi:hypothetical protein
MFRIPKRRSIYLKHFATEPISHVSMNLVLVFFSII